jgi:uncharacterized protein YbgA (DUF1722 family)/uncharacterized protein YbbK (DUF523 family)
MTGQARVRVAVSACLLGQKVRFDGGHKHDRYLTEVLGELLDWFPVCPELELGLGAPRESLRLVDGEDGPRLVAPRSGRDHTEPMRELAARRVGDALAAGVRGWILKKDSPTCGMSRVRIYGAGGMPHRDGAGILAAEIARLAPNLPVEEEGRLQDPRLRESFLTRLLVYDRWRRCREGGMRAAGLVAFHRDHKLLVLAHDPEGYRSLGRLVADAGCAGLDERLDAYEERLMAALSRTVSAGRHANAMQHAIGMLELAGGDRDELTAAIDEYRQGWVPLAVPMTLLRHHLMTATAADRAPAWLAAQVYLDPHPRRLGLWSR